MTDNTQPLNLTLRLWNGVWTAFEMGKVYAEWRNAGHDSALSLDKAIDSIPNDSLRYAMRLVAIDEKICDR